MPDTPLNPPPHSLTAARTDRVLARKWWKRRPLQIAGGAAAVAALIALVMIVVPPANTVSLDGNTIDSGEVIRAPYQDYIALRSEVMPLDVIYITAETSGRVDTVIAQDGQQVTPGQALARLSNPDLTLDVSSREADISGRLSDTNSQLMNLQTQQKASEQTIADVTYALHKAEQALAKFQTLRDQNVVNDAAVKPYADDVEYQKSRLNALQASQGSETAFYKDQRQQILASANDLRQSLGEVRQGLNALTISAPTSGRLTDFDLKPGQAVKQGDPLGEVDSEGTYKLTAQVDEFYLSRLSTGLKAQANVHGQTVGVHISKVFPQVTNNRITVELEFDGQDGGQMPSGLTRGEAVDVRLSLGDTQQALLAPAGAWLNDTNGTSVFVLNASGDKADRRTITVGRRNPEFVEILSGLKPGERIVTGGTSNLTKSQHIRLTKSKNTES